MLALGSFQWLAAPPTRLGQAIGDYCSQLSPQLITATLSDFEQSDYLEVRRAYDSGTADADQRARLVGYEARCNEAYRTTGIPQGANAQVYSLQKQINQILSVHDCQIGEDGILGDLTCGSAKMINEKGWGTVTVPAACATLGQELPPGCKETAVVAPTARRGGGGGAALVIGALVVLGVVGVALAGRT